MRARRAWFACWVLLAGCLWSAVAHAESEPPRLLADFSLQALYVTQQNFRVEEGIYGRTLDAEAGNFNNEVGDDNYRNLVETAFRFGLTGQFTDAIAARAAFEFNPLYAREQGFGDPQADLPLGQAGQARAKNYYLQVEHPVGGFLGYRIGRQDYSTPQSLILARADANGAALWYRSPETGRFLLAAAILDTEGTSEIEDVYANFSYEFPEKGDVSGSFYFSALTFRDRTDGAANSPPEITVNGTNGIGEWLMGRSDATTASLADGSLFWAGTEIAYEKDGAALDVNAAFNFGNVDPGYNSVARIDTVQGYLAMLDGSYGREWWRFGAAGAYVSGHDPKPSADRYTGFLDINANFGFTRFFFNGGPYLVATGFRSPSVQGSGLLAAKAYTKFTPLEWLVINLQGAALGAQYNRPQVEERIATPNLMIPYRQVARGAGSYYGTEADLWLEFKPMQRLTWLVEVDYFHPGNYFKGPGQNRENPPGFLDELDPAWRVAGGVLFN